ncbi:uncharacterized protein BDR25DRAFT_362775 [Lindgomyces ingoldianus]|uniref:Uncharacterized protein n=1 Tax=Lindgomyces ingoldianus TaxID=673940 RepID=A0ACB6Q914_9PLEO|nr:uncharacterized protein BDR25DRAFT_362775 [Lindgomyces ingoldianus]KAF2463429.1 hypothetical protein BDR25DRAFT_362775 [Lindgomyces ingoldianus]
MAAVWGQPSYRGPGHACLAISPRFPDLVQSVDGYQAPWLHMAATLCRKSPSSRGSPPQPPLVGRTGSKSPILIPGLGCGFGNLGKRQVDHHDPARIGTRENLASPICGPICQKKGPPFTSTIMLANKPQSRRCFGLADSADTPLLTLKEEELPRRRLTGKEGIQHIDALSDSHHFRATWESDDWHRQPLCRCRVRFAQLLLHQANQTSQFQMCSSLAPLINDNSPVLHMPPLRHPFSSCVLTFHLLVITKNFLAQDFRTSTTVPTSRLATTQSDRFTPMPHRDMYILSSNRRSLFTPALPHNFPHGTRFRDTGQYQEATLTTPRSRPWQDAPTDTTKYPGALTSNYLVQSWFHMKDSVQSRNYISIHAALHPLDCLSFGLPAHLASRTRFHLNNNSPPISLSPLSSPSFPSRFDTTNIQPFLAQYLAETPVIPHWISPSSFEIADRIGKNMSGATQACGPRVVFKIAYRWRSHIMLAETYLGNHVTTLSKWWEGGAAKGLAVFIPPKIGSVMLNPVTVLSVLFLALRTLGPCENLKELPRSFNVCKTSTSLGSTCPPQGFQRGVVLYD